MQHRADGREAESCTGDDSSEAPGVQRSNALKQSHARVTPDRHTHKRSLATASAGGKTVA